MKRVIDYWSIPHFLFGVVMALLTVVSGLYPVPMFVVTLGVAIFWEIFEAKVHIGEGFTNAMSDIILPLIAFPLTYVAASHPAITPDHRVALFVVALLLYIYSNAVAWRARYEDHDPDFFSS